MGLGFGLGVGLGLGIGVGVGADGEPDDALTAPPPQPTAKQIKEKNRTQPMIFGPMGNGLLHNSDVRCSSAAGCWSYILTVWAREFWA
jgi:hypothetical protein